MIASGGTASPDGSCIHLLRGGRRLFSLASTSHFGAAPMSQMHPFDDAGQVSLDFVVAVGPIPMLKNAKGE